MLRQSPISFPVFLLYLLVLCTFVLFIFVISAVVLLSLSLADAIGKRVASEWLSLFPSISKLSGPQLSPSSAPVPTPSYYYGTTKEGERSEPTVATGRHPLYLVRICGQRQESERGSNLYIFNIFLSLFFVPCPFPLIFFLVFYSLSLIFVLVFYLFLCLAGIASNICFLFLSFFLFYLYLFAVSFSFYY